MKSMGVAEWTGGATAAALFYPSITIICMMVVDLIEWAESASDTPPFTSFILLSIIWMAISVCFSYYGSIVGYKANPFATP